MAIKEDIIIKCRDVSWIVDNRAILSDVNLEIKRGEFISLIGLNGAGKSSLCKLILELIKPTKGQIIRQKDLSVSYVPQFFDANQLVPLKIEDFMQLTLRKVETEEIKELLLEVELWDKRHLPLQSLSGGERQRLLVAKALLSHPNLLVLDEAFSHVNLSGQQKLIQLINKKRKLIDFSILMVSHDMFWVMAQTDRVICVNHGISCSGEPLDISQDPMISSLLGEDFTKNLAYYHHNHHHKQVDKNKK
ncbi:MAG: metal ABC transporter ATP-binding protein [Alphaproteobacteria bacterium]